MQRPVFVGAACTALVPAALIVAMAFFAEAAFTALVPAALVFMAFMAFFVEAAFIALVPAALVFLAFMAFFVAAPFIIFIASAFGKAFSADLALEAMLSKHESQRDKTEAC